MYCTRDSRSMRDRRNRFDSIRFDSIRCDATRRDATRLDSTRLDSIGSLMDEDDGRDGTQRGSGGGDGGGGGGIELELSRFFQEVDGFYGPARQRAKGWQRERQQVKRNKAAPVFTFKSVKKSVVREFKLPIPIESAGTVVDYRKCPRGSTHNPWPGSAPCLH